MSVEDRLLRANLSYRDPELYDDMLLDDTTAQTIADLAETRATGRSLSALDLGCGTGRVGASLDEHHGMRVTGVDIQPTLVAYAQEHTPGPAWQVGDIRTVRLPGTFDVIACVGNTASYLHTNGELQELFDTITAHSHSATLLVIATIDRIPSQYGVTQRQRMGTRHGPVDIDVRTTWHPDAQLLSTTREWYFANGRVERDSFSRRVWTRDILHKRAEAAGFRCSDSKGSVSLIAVRE